MSGPAGRDAKDEPVNSGIPPAKARHPFIPPASPTGFRLSPGGYGRPRRPVPDAVYHLDRLFQTRSTAYIPVGVPSRRIPDILSINDDGVEMGLLPSRQPLRSA